MVKYAGSSAGVELQRPGRASLAVDLVFAESTVTSCYSTSPMRLLTPRSRGRSVWAYTSSFGGGMVAGDQTSLDLRLGAETRCFLGTQAWTKVYRNPAQVPSRHETRATVDPGAVLVFAPDPIQAFANSNYVQSQEFHLAADASLFLLDWCSAGRVASGERWRFKSFESRNEVFVDGQRVFFDSLLLEPEDGPLTGPHRVGRFNCLATLLMIGPALREQATRLLERLRREPVARRGEWVASASPVADGVVLRVAGIDFERVAVELRQQMALLTDLLADDPWSRKW